jgi:hypothetical protein
VIYAFDITTPANTTQAAPKRTRLKVTKGLVYQVEIEFPPGPLGYCHVAIFDGGHQIWPSNSEFDFHGDNGMMVFNETYLKMAAPYEFVCQTWNEDDTYQHQVHVRLGMVSDEVFMARYLPSISFDKMLAVLNQVQQRQEAERESLLTEPVNWLE